MDALNTTCYVLNRALIKPILNKTTYELYYGRKHNVSYLHVFWSKYFKHDNGKDNLNKFDAKFNKAIFIRYFSSNKAFYVYRKRALNIKESIDVTFDEFPLSVDKFKKEDNQDSSWMPYTINLLHQGKDTKVTNEQFMEKVIDEDIVIR